MSKKATLPVRLGLVLIVNIVLTGGILPHDSLTGTYAYHVRGMAGLMTVVDLPGQPVRVSIETSKTTPAHDTCSLSVRPARGTDGSLSGPAVDADGTLLADTACRVRIAPLPHRRLVVTENQCWIAVCGVHARFDGEYRLRSRDTGAFPRP